MLKKRSINLMYDKGLNFTRSIPQKESHLALILVNWQNPKIQIVSEFISIFEITIYTEVILIK